MNPAMNRHLNSDINFMIPLLYELYLLLSFNLKLLNICTCVFSTAPLVGVYNNNNNSGEGDGRTIIIIQIANIQLVYVGLA